MTTSVVVAVGDAGRALLATARSVIVAAPDAEVLVVVRAGAVTAVEAVLAGAGLDGVRIVTADGPRHAQRTAGIAAAAGEVVAVVDAGDLVDGRFLSEAAARLALEPHVVVHPEHAVTFGGRDGWWPQPRHDDGVTLLPVAAAWASVVVAHRDTWRRSPYPAVDDEVVDAGWQASVARLARHVRAARTLVFVRVWGGDAPWEAFDPALAAVAPLLVDPVVAAPRAAAFAARPAARVPERLRRVATPLVGPWRPLARRVAHRALPVAPGWALESWRAANRIEPLVLFPRSQIVGMLERVDDVRPRLQLTALAYWWAAARLGTVDILYFAPWLGTGGGDLVLRDYIEAVLRLAPGARVGLVTTEPDPSTRLGELDRGVGVVELGEALRRGVARDDLVVSVVPALLVQLAPATVHAFNSTVAFDVVERSGQRLRSAIFLSTFAVDRRPDGERTSVLFLRRPGFLDPVRAVLVDSDAMLATVVGELGYPAERFRVQRSSVRPVDPAPRPAPRTPLRVLWAGRFDLPKRLDVVVTILERARRAGLALEVHVYGVEVMGHPGLADILRRLDEQGAVRHPPFSTFSDLDPADFDAYLLTSEWEGVPLGVLEAMSAGIPVVASTVGGVGEVVTAETGHPVAPFDDADAYVAALADIAADPESARERADAAHALIRRSFSPLAFDARLREIDGYLPG